MMYAVINSKRENGDYKRTWGKYQTLQAAKEEEAKHQDNDDCSEIYVPYDKYVEMVHRLKMLESDLNHIRDLCIRSGETIYSRVDKEVLDDTI